MPRLADSLMLEPPGKNRERALAWAYYFKGYDRYLNYEYKDAIALFFQAYRYKDIVDSLELRYLLFRSLSITRESQGQNEEALKYVIRSFNYAIKLEDSLRIASAEAWMGYIYLAKLESPLMAYPKLFSAYNLALNMNDQALVGEIAMDLSAYHRTQKEYEQAKTYAQQAIRVNESLKDTLFLSDSYAALGDIASIQGDARASQQNYLKALELKLAIHDQVGLAAVYHDLGEMHLRVTKQYRYAIRYLESGIAYAKAIGSLDLEKDIVCNLTKVYAYLQNRPQTQYYYDQCNILTDSLHKQSIAQSISKLNEKYELARKDRQITLQELELLRQEKYLSTIYLLLGLSVLLGSGYAAWNIWRRYKTVKKTQHKLEVVNKQIYEQNRQLQRYNKEMEQFAFIASHELKEPLTLIIGYCNMLKKKDIDFNMVSSAVNTQNIAHKMSLLLDDMMRSMESQRRNEKINYTDTQILVERLIEELRQDPVYAKVSFYIEPLPAIKAPALHLSQIFKGLIYQSLLHDTTQELGKRLVISHKLLEMGNVFIVRHSPEHLGVDTANIAPISPEQANNLYFTQCITERMSEVIGGKVWNEPERNSWFACIPKLP